MCDITDGPVTAGLKSHRQELNAVMPHAPPRHHTTGHGRCDADMASCDITARDSRSSGALTHTISMTPKALAAWCDMGPTTHRILTKSAQSILIKKKKI